MRFSSLKLIKDHLLTYPTGMRKVDYLNFDELSEMWRNDKEAAEAYHRSIIEDFILGLPEDKQERARGLQWRIDQELRKYKDPIARMNRMVEMMWESFFELDATLNRGVQEERPKANVLTFKPRDSI
jgi:hypothetical protein